MTKYFVIHLSEIPLLSSPLPSLSSAFIWAKPTHFHKLFFYSSLHSLGFLALINLKITYTFYLNYLLIIYTYTCIYTYTYMYICIYTYTYIHLFCTFLGYWDVPNCLPFAEWLQLLCFVKLCFGEFVFSIFYVCILQSVFLLLLMYLLLVVFCISLSSSFYLLHLIYCGLGKGYWNFRICP